jgi:tRNA-2-methylthio-N6-dimethylallyladenosine synthase
MDAPGPMAHIPTPRKKAYVETYGCQMNVADGELMQGILAAEGYDIVARPEDADVVLVNTCAIREHAEQRVIGRVGELNRLKTARPDMIIGVTGCMAQRLGSRLLDRAGHVDLVMGPDGYRELPLALGRLRADHPAAAAGQLPAEGALAVPAEGASAGSVRRALPVLPTMQTTQTTQATQTTQTTQTTQATQATQATLPVLPVQPVLPVPDPAAAGMEYAPALAEGAAADRLAVLDFNAAENYEGLEVRRASAISAWVPVQRGCDHRCTYCIVPYVRGPEKNRSPDHILAEVRRIAEQGITEVTLLGQTVNSWNWGEWRFAQLLRAVARVDGIRRVRFTSPHPNDVTPDLVEVLATEPHVCKQLHLPVQSGHDRTLKRMLRRYTAAAYLDRVQMVRAAVPEIALSTDVIVAFPGETDEEYEATLDLMREVRYADAFLYKYSPRDGTPATRLPAEQFVPAALAQERLQRLIDVQRAIQAEVNGAVVGRVVEVLVERAARSAGDMLGRADDARVVAFPGDASLVGRYVDVRLTSTTGATFRGVCVPDGADGATRSVA